MLVAAASEIHLNGAALVSCAAVSGIVVAAMAFAIDKTRELYLSNLAPQDLALAIAPDATGSKAKRLSKAIAPLRRVHAILFTGRLYRGEMPPAST